MHIVIAQTSAFTSAASPLGADLVTVAALVAGLAMWLIGRRLIRPLYTVLFAAIGGLIGFILPAATAVDINPNITLAAGVVLGGLAGLALFRISMAVALATMLGVVAPVATAFFLRIQPAAFGEAQQGPLTSEQMFLSDIPLHDHAPLSQRAKGFDGSVADAVGWDAAAELVDRETERLAPGLELSDESKAEIRRRAEQSVRFLRALRDEAGAEWSRLPERHRFALVISAALGVLGGLVAGLAAPKHVAAVTTSFVGAAAWIGAGAILARTHGIVGPELLPSSAAAWVLVWLMISAIGAALQWTALRPRADKSKE